MLLITLALVAIPSCQPLGHKNTPRPAVAPPPGLSRSAFSLRKIEDVPLPGAAVRFDYQSLDTTTDRLYIAHMDADALVVFDVKDRRVVADLDGFIKVHGVLAVPDIGRVYASITAKGEVAVIDASTLAIRARVGGIEYPDGMAYAPNARQLFVSDEHGRADAVIDIFADTLIMRIPLGGEAGNTVYDPVTACILVAVHETAEIVVINPETDRIVARIKVPGIEQPHGIVLDAARRVAFVAGAKNAKLAVLDLDSARVTATYSVGPDPDVLAVDPTWGRVYVASESGTISAFSEVVVARQIVLVHDGDFFLPNAHTISVDPRTHLIYLPLFGLGAQPVLRIMTASPPQ